MITYRWGARAGGRGLGRAQGGQVRKEVPGGKWVKGQHMKGARWTPRMYDGVFISAHTPLYQGVSR